MAELTAKNSALVAEVEEWVREEERLKDEVRRLHELRASKLEDVRQFLSSVTGKVAEGALELSKLVDVAKRVGFEFPLPGKSQTAAPWPLAPWTERSGSDALPVRVNDLPEILTTAASNANLPSTTIASLDVALRAGMLPTLHGPDVDYLLDVYAACVTGGQIFRMVLDPSVLGPDDLWRYPATGRETALGETWRAAVADPARVFLLCMDNAGLRGAV